MNAFYNNFKMTSFKTIKYAKISLKRRQKLVQLVSQSDMSIAKAARMLSLKLSTAKLIVKRYKENGSFFESKTAKQKRLAIEKSEERGEIIEENGEILRREDQVHEEFQGNVYPSIQDDTIVHPFIWNSLFWSSEYQNYYWAYPYLSIQTFQ